MIDVNKQIRKDYTKDVENELTKNNDVTNIKKENYKMKR
jgi:hypothetical protein